jgi:hypothetical protein
MDGTTQFKYSCWLSCMRKNVIFSRDGNDSSLSDHVYLHRIQDIVRRHDVIMCNKYRKWDSVHQNIWSTTNSARAISTAIIDTITHIETHVIDNDFSVLLDSLMSIISHVTFDYWFFTHKTVRETYITISKCAPVHVYSRWYAYQYTDTRLDDFFFLSVILKFVFVRIT